MNKEIIIRMTEVRRFMIDCLVKSGADKVHAAQLANVLLDGDYRGHFSHGLNRLPLYLRELEKGLCIGRGDPNILKESPATAWVCGKNLLGPVVGNFCMDLAIRKAKQIGVGWVAAKGSNHFGIAGWYSMRAANQGMIGMAYTNATPLMFPTRSKQIALGTNAMSVAAPGVDGDQFVLDMATSAVSQGQIEIANRKGLDIPKGWAADKFGNETTRAKDALEGGLLPLAGQEMTGGYKGYGLSAMVEILCGLSAGANWGPHIRHWKASDRFANLGQCFVAINPEFFAPNFKEETQDFMDTLRSLKPVDPAKPVQIAGDPERQHMAMCDQLGGIPYHSNQIKRASKLAADMDVEPMISAKSDVTAAVGV